MPNFMFLNLATNMKQQQIGNFPFTHSKENRMQKVYVVLLLVEREGAVVGTALSKQEQNIVIYIY